jgi:hypothetical protein
MTTITTTPGWTKLVAMWSAEQAEHAYVGSYELNALMKYLVSPVC